MDTTDSTQEIRDAVAAFIRAHPQVVYWNFGPGLRAIAEGKRPAEAYRNVGE